MLQTRSSFYIALFVVFVDYMGLALIYPLFSSMLFNSSLPLLHPETSGVMRGVVLSLLMALMPLSQFFFAPLWGALSDNQGRRSPLILSLSLALIGYLIALSGVFLSSLALLLISRVVIGCAAGNIGIVQAAVADLSTPATKTKNFGLYSMALGLGFTLGPFLGGLLSLWSFTLPFLFATFVVILNLIFTLKFFTETHHVRTSKELKWNIGLKQLKKALIFKSSRPILLASFFHNFGWSYFSQFSSVYLISTFHFNPAELGYFFAAGAFYYAISSGFLIRTLIGRLKPETLFCGGMFCTACTLFIVPCLPSSLWIWPAMFVICYFVSFVQPTATTLISHRAPEAAQGEALGILGSVNTIAAALSSLLSGPFVGINAALPMWGGGAMMMIGACVVLAAFRDKLFQLPKTI